MFLRTKYFIVVEGYNPRIHALYFCPQLFRHDSGRLVPLEGEEIGQLIARAVEASAIERRPWYEPMEKLPQDPLINGAMVGEFDTLVVELPPKQSLCRPPANNCWAAPACASKLLNPARCRFSRVNHSGESRGPLIRIRRSIASWVAFMPDGGSKRSLRLNC